MRVSINSSTTHYPVDDDIRQYTLYYSQCCVLVLFLLSRLLVEFDHQISVLAESNDRQSVNVPFGPF